MRVPLAVFLCGLFLHTVSCQTVELQFATEGVPVNGKSLTARSDDMVSIRCSYPTVLSFGQVPSLAFKPKDETNEEAIFVFGGQLQGRWNTDEYNIESDHQGEVFLKLTINDVSTVDEGQYICYLKVKEQVLAEDSGDVSVAANVDQVILDGVTNGIYRVPDDNSLFPIICTAINGSSPTMRLEIEGSDSVNLETVLTVTPQGSEYVGSHNYRFSPDQDGKEIKCVAVVSGYDPMNAIATLQIQGRPVVTCPEKVKGNLNEKVKISCTITSKPKADRGSIRWTVENDGTWFYGDASNADLGYSSKITDLGDGYKVDLDLTILDEQSYTRYSLGAENTAGHNYKEVKVEKKPSLDTTKDNSATDLLPFTLTTLLVMACYHLFI